jgi:hypothetical protein
MIRKVIGIGVVVATILATFAFAHAQSSTGRKQGCWGSNGKHHSRIWCINHGIQPG